MLAYVFWHSPRGGMQMEAYEAAHRAFLRALLESPSAGLRGVRVNRTDGVPWLGSARQVLEDWYLVDDSAALDPLNEAAVSGSRQQPHDRVAALAADGTAGLYRLRLGTLPDTPPALAHWFAKPDGMSYRALLDSLREPCRNGATLWGRQMVLGPTPEFCLHGDNDTACPYSGVTVALAKVLSSLKR